MTETPSLTALRAAVLHQGGEWTRRRAVETLNGHISPERARQLLNHLVNEGRLVRYGKQGYLWTVPEPTGVIELTTALMQQARAIPGVEVEAEAVTANAFMVKHIGGRIFRVQVSDALVGGE